MILSTFIRSLSIVITLVSFAQAHETWIMPAAFEIEAGQELRFNAMSGMEFPKPEGPIRLERIAKAAFRLGAEELELKGLEATKSSLVIRQAFSKSGVATIWLDLKPNKIQLDDETVEEYLDEIDASKAIRRLWSNQRGKLPWNESYTKHAKTFVVVGDASADTSWGEPVGAALEIVPDSSPFSIRAGQDFPVRVLSDSEPLAGLPIGLLIEGTTKRVFRVTNEKGEVTLPMNRPGRAMIFGVYLRFDDEQQKWISDFCNLTVRIQD